MREHLQELRIKKEMLEKQIRAGYGCAYDVELLNEIREQILNAEEDLLSFHGVKSIQ